jgi:hypothetical protein
MWGPRGWDKLFPAASTIGIPTSSPVQQLFSLLLRRHRMLLLLCASSSSFLLTHAPPRKQFLQMGMMLLLLVAAVSALVERTQRLSNLLASPRSF